MSTQEIAVKQSTCRVCLGYCPVNVTLEGNRVAKVEGNKEAPLYEGFICPKGRALASSQSEDRLHHHLKRQPDGSFSPISSDQLVDEVSAKIEALIDQYGPESIAAFTGGPGVEQPALMPLVFSFMRSIGSNNIFGSETIDQPGVNLAKSLHGAWRGSYARLDDLDVMVLIGTNPIISKLYLTTNPGATLKRLKKGGMKLIVIDPRRNETSRHADVHLQCIPGEDPTLLAGLLHLLFERGGINEQFAEVNASGLDTLRNAVAGFNAEYVTQRTGVSAEDLERTVNILAESKMGAVWPGVGPSMATRGTLTAYLSLCLQTVRGFWPGAGAKARRHPVLVSGNAPKAQPSAPQPAWGFGKQFRTRGLQQTSAGMPTAALPGEILTPGEGQIRAVFMHAGSLLTWPDSKLAKKALESLDLLIVPDTLSSLTPTAKIAHYVLATKHQLETPFISQINELVPHIHPGYGWEEPYAAYSPVVVDPPEGADLLEPWQLYYRVAQKLGRQLCLMDPKSMHEIDMENEPTTDQLYELICRNSTVPLAEVKKHTNYKVFDEVTQTIQPRDPECTDKLALADMTMMEELDQVASESYQDRRGTDATYQYLLIPRRMQKMNNAQHLPPSLNKVPYNPAYMHSADLEVLKLRPGDKVKITSRHGEITGFVDVDNNLRQGVLSMCHGSGSVPGSSDDPAVVGSNVNSLLSWEDDYDPYVGIPRMGALPISVEPLPRAQE